MTADPTNAHPSRRSRLATSAPTNATAAATAIAVDTASPRIAWAHSRNATATTAVTRPTGRIKAAARSRITPSVLSRRNIRPWVTNRSSVVRPPRSPNGLSSVTRLPVNCLSASIGTPWTMLAKATPHSSAGRKLPIATA